MKLFILGLVTGFISFTITLRGSRGSCCQSRLLSQKFYVAVFDTRYHYAIFKFKLVPLDSLNNYHGFCDLISILFLAFPCNQQQMFLTFLSSSSRCKIRSNKKYIDFLRSYTSSSQNIHLFS